MRFFYVKFRLGAQQLSRRNQTGNGASLRQRLARDTRSTDWKMIRRTSERLILTRRLGSRTFAARSRRIVSKPDQNRPGARQPHADLAAGNGVRVGPAGRQVRFGEIQVTLVERTELAFVRQLQQIRGLQTNRGQFVRRQVATSFAQIRRQVAQDVDQLQPFAEADPLSQQPASSSFALGNRCARHILVQNSPTQPATR